MIRGLRRGQTPSPCHRHVRSIVTPAGWAWLFDSERHRAPTPAVEATARLYFGRAPDRRDSQDPGNVDADPRGAAAPREQRPRGEPPLGAG